jgi:hypothetical protein
MLPGTGPQVTKRIVNNVRTPYVESIHIGEGASADFNA